VDVVDPVDGRRPRHVADDARLLPGMGDLGDE
jgi:hypothetical protein